jgi:hypothetical protein
MASQQERLPVVQWKVQPSRVKGSWLHFQEETKFKYRSRFKHPTPSIALFTKGQEAIATWWKHELSLSRRIYWLTYLADGYAERFYLAPLQKGWWMEGLVGNGDCE